MTRQSDLFKGLKEHGIEPPTAVRENLFHVLNTGSNPFGPNSFADKVVSLPAMGFLQQELIAPPGNAFGQILQRILQEQKKSRQSIGRIYRYSAIAACLVLALTGWRIFKTNSRPPSSRTDRLQTAAVSNASNTSPVADSTAVAANVADAKATVAGKDTGTAADINTPTGKQGSVIVDDYFRTSRLRVNGQAIPLVDNDLLVTLTSFEYNEVPGFLTGDELNTKDEVSTKIQVDQYAAITISPEMRQMMKKMYTYRSKGVPTRRARKEREKLQEWKKADESRFDGSNGKSPLNPLNPVDLATFIFK